MSLVQNIDPLSELFLHLTVKATLLLAAAWLVTRLLSFSSAAVRHLVWTLTMGALVLLPLLSWWLPGWQLPLLPARSAHEGTRRAVEMAAWPPIRSELIRELGVDGSPAANGPTPERNQSPSLGESVDAISSPSPAKIMEPTHWPSLFFVGIWLAGTILSVCRIMVGLRQVWKLAQNSVHFHHESWRGSLSILRERLGLKRSVVLRESRQSMVPLTWGVLRPTILLPPEARDWPESLRRAVLLHELAHVLRWDVAHQLLGRLACAVYWFHPLAWFALRRLREECEQACDDIVVHAGVQASNYAEQLLEVARLYSPRAGVTLAVEMARGTKLETRLGALFDMARGHGPLRPRWALASLLLVSLFLCIVAVVRPVPLIQAVANDDVAQEEFRSAAVPGQERPAIRDERKARTTQGRLQAVTKGKMRVRVVDSEGKPLAKANVFSNSATNVKGFPWNRNYYTDESGETEIVLPETIQILRLWARKEGYSPMHANWEPEFQPDGHLIPDRYEFQLDRGTTIGGVVTNAMGRPISNVRVSVQYPDELASTITPVRLMNDLYLAEDDPWNKVNPARVTDDAGRWTLDNVPEGDDVEVLLKFAHPDFEGDAEWGFLQKQQDIQMRDLRNQVANVVLKRKSAGIKVNTALPAPTIPVDIVIAEHVILWGGNEIVTWEQVEQKMAKHPDPSRLHPSFWLTRKGEEREKGVGEQAMRLKKRFNYYGYSYGSPLPYNDVRFDRIRSAEDLKQDEANRLEGRVLDADGKPVAEAEVLLISPLPPELAYRTRDLHLRQGRVQNPIEHVITRTDVQGRFRCYPEAGKTFALLALHPEIGFAIVRKEHLANENNLKLAAWAGLVCRLADDQPEYYLSLDSRPSVGARDDLLDLSINLDSGVERNPDSPQEFRFEHIPAPLFQTIISRSFPDKDAGVTYPLEELRLNLAPGETRTIGLGPPTQQQREELEKRRRDSRERMEEIEKESPIEKPAAVE